MVYTSSQHAHLQRITLHTYALAFNTKPPTQSSARPQRQIPHATVRRSVNACNLQKKRVAYTCTFPSYLPETAYTSAQHARTVDALHCANLRSLLKAYSLRKAAWRRTGRISFVTSRPETPHTNATTSACSQFIPPAHRQTWHTLLANAHIDNVLHCASSR